MGNSKPVVIEVEGVHKKFLLPHEKVTTIKSMFTNLLRGKRSRTISVQHALEDITFEVNKGDFFGIVGRNGSGKSTLLKILAGIYQPTNGSVAVSGKLVPFIELGVGFNPELTGRENVYLNGALLGFSKEEISAMYDDIVEFAELNDFMDQRLKNYSSGMQVRLAFSLAVRARADILLIDEVLAVGDAEFQRKCYRYFRKLKKEGVTVVFVSHDMNAVREYCNKAVLIEKHKIVASGSAAKIAAMYDRLMSPEVSAEASGTGEEPLVSKRWGDQTVIVKEAVIKTLDQERIIFNVEIEAGKQCDNPVVGFVLKKATGDQLLGTNTMLQQSPLPSLGPKATAITSFEIPNILPEGEYTITVAAQYDGGATSGDWWEDAISFEVQKTIHTPYPIQPEVKVNIEG